MNKKASKPEGAERRKSRRQPVLDSFSLFLVVPKKGIHRLPIGDLSEGGIGFDLDTEGESPQDFPVKQGDSIEILLYLNQSLYLPLEVKIVRSTEKNLIRKIGGEFTGRSSKAFKAFQSFLRMLEDIAEVAKVDPSKI